MSKYNIDDLSSGQKTHTNIIFSAGLDLILIILAALVTLVLVLTPQISSTVIRQLVASLFILFVPGYAFAAALYPKKTDISDIGRLILSFAFSAIIVPAIGVLLSFTPWGITLTSIAVGLSLIIGLLLAIAFERRRNLLQNERFSWNLASARHIRERVFPSFETRFNKGLTSVLIVALLVSTLAVTYAVLRPGNGEHFTEFYILGPQGTADNYPTQYLLGGQQSVIVGITNNEQHDQSYDLVVTLNNNSKLTTLYSEQITVANNQRWEKSIGLRPDQTGSNMEMEFLLYLNQDHSSPYRTTHLWVNVTNPS
jgi:uncharacterized membrane protein